MQPYSAVVLGSTGNVGRQIVNLLVASPAVRQVVVVNRRQTDEFKSMPKVREVVVPPAVQCVLPSRYHAIYKNELARAMFEGTQKAPAELQQKRAQGGALPEPEVRFYEYSDMKPFFNKDDRKD